MKESLFDFCTHEAQKELLQEWHPTKNGALTQQDVTLGSNKKVWWKCSREHEWVAEVRERIRGSGCPFCANKRVMPGENDFASRCPTLAAEWDPDKNAPLRPEQVSPFSQRCVWWRCKNGHEWQQTVTARTKKQAACPYCTDRKALAGYNDLKTVQPGLAAQWHPTRNGDLTPEMVTVRSSKKVWWQCACGCSWEAVISKRVASKNSCPACVEGNTDV